MGSMLPLLVPTILFGVYPQPLIDLIRGAVGNLVTMVQYVV
jgi:NADH:ubiquinone oxidoreductase subunit 4 (subunit M)